MEVPVGHIVEEKIDKGDQIRAHAELAHVIGGAATTLADESSQHQLIEKIVALFAGVVRQHQDQMAALQPRLVEFFERAREQRYDMSFFARLFGVECDWDEATKRACKDVRKLQETLDAPHRESLKQLGQISAAVITALSEPTGTKRLLGEMAQHLIASGAAKPDDVQVLVRKRTRK